MEINWKNKYLKYKSKYTQLKIKYNNQQNQQNQQNYTQEYFDTLKNLYPSCVKKSNESGETTETYGEMEYIGIEKLNHIINPTNQLRYFIDIGSGRGKLPCWFAGIDGIIKSIGIEIVNSRHLDGLELVKNLSKKFLNITNKIELEFGSVQNYNLGQMVSNNPDTLIWISNLCFGEELTNLIFTQILNQMPKGTKICCSKKPVNINDSNTVNKLKINLDILHIQMSWWSNLSDVYVCEII